MDRNTKTKLLCSIGAGLLALSTPVSGQYVINWFKIAGGGGTSVAGNYQLNGTVGQHDATGPITNGNYYLSGGFWSLVAIQVPGAPFLSIARTGTNTVMVSWPSPSTGWNLQMSSNIAATNWSAPPQTVQDNGTNRFINVTNPMSGNNFYRLNQ